MALLTSDRGSDSEHVLAIVMDDIVLPHRRHAEDPQVFRLAEHKLAVVTPLRVLVDIVFGPDFDPVATKVDEECFECEQGVIVARKLNVAAIRR